MKLTEPAGPTTETVHPPRLSSPGTGAEVPLHDQGTQSASERGGVWCRNCGLHLDRDVAVEEVWQCKALFPVEG